jgi:uncharacterized protein YbjQ (UPF0145 family)
MDGLTVTFINLGIPLALVFIGLVVGTILEKKHYKSIRKREKTFINLPLINIDSYDKNRTLRKSYLVSGSVVISVDYFKLFLAGLRNIFGGRVVTYESLVDRARREAILRMKEKCPAANLIINLRVETSTISKQGRSGQKSVGCVEVIAYGTAIQYVN